MKSNILKIIPGIFILMIAINISAQPTFPGKLGINLGMIDYVDWVKVTNGVYHTYGSHIQLEVDSLDANLWPKCDFVVVWDHRPAREWDAGTNPIDDPEKYRIDYSGIYHGSFYGSAELYDVEPHGTWTFQNINYDAATNKTTFEVNMSPPGPQHGLIVIGFRHTRRTVASDTNTGVTNFKFIRPGYDSSSTKTYTDDEINLLSKTTFSNMRAMVLTGTTQLKIVYPDTIGWKTRKLLSDPWWGGGIGKKPEAAPWEIFIDICNQTNMDIWVNIPIAATDDYMIQLAKLIQSRLKSNLNIYIEIDDEPWGFDNPRNYNEAEAKVKSITAAQNFAVHEYRAAIAFQKVFGNGTLNNKIRVVPMWWTLFPADLDKMCDYITKTYGAANQYFYGIGVADYFSNKLMDGSQAGSIEDIVISAYNSADADTATYKQVAGIAAKYNLTAKGCIAYEGGAAMCNPGNPNQITARNDIEAYRDSCMAAAVRKHYISYFKTNAVIGDYFQSAAGFNRYGCWGLTDDPAKPDRTSLFKAMQELLGNVSSPVPPDKLFAIKGKNNYYQLSWKDQSNNETSFIIERKDTSGKYILVKNVPPNVTMYVDTVKYYTPKYYRIKAVNGSGTSTYANLAMVIDSTPPPAPLGLTIYNVTNSSLRAKWNKATWSDIKTYIIYKDGILLGTTTDTNYTMIGLSCGKTYKINVVTLSTSNIKSSFSDTATVQMCLDLSESTSSATIFPNPTSGRILISGLDATSAISVISIDGALLLTTNSVSSEKEIDISGFPAGIYLVRISNGRIEKVFKVVKI